MRPTTTFDAYCADHVRSAAGAPRAPVARGDMVMGAEPMGFQAAAAAQLSDLTAAQLERVSRFGVLPSGPSRMKKAVGASDLLSEDH
eukprot:scaffold48731_cov61-Phaeocystis_antarctica.AAC.4